MNYRRGTIKYFGVRYFNPGLLIWLTVDPKSLHTDQYRLPSYVYVSYRPYLLVDADGLDDIVIQTSKARIDPNIKTQESQEDKDFFKALRGTVQDYVKDRQVLRGPNARDVHVITASSQADFLAKLNNVIRRLEANNRPLERVIFAGHGAKYGVFKLVTDTQNAGRDVNILGHHLSHVQNPRKPASEVYFFACYVYDANSKTRVRSEIELTNGVRRAFGNNTSIRQAVFYRGNQQEKTNLFVDYQYSKQPGGSTRYFIKDYQLNIAYSYTNYQLRMSDAISRNWWRDVYNQ